MMGAGLDPVEWLGMKFAVPADWEIVRHSVKREKGVLVFVDRRFQRLSLAWVECPSRPDLERMRADRRARDEEENPGSAFTPVRCDGRFRGYRWKYRGVTVTRAGWFDASSSRWLELVFSWPAACDDALERTVIERFTSSDIRGRTPRWRAFGMNVTPAENWELAQWIVVPADTTMRFTQNEAQLTVRRTKLVEGWYNGSPRETVVQRIGKARADCSAVTVNGHEACAARSREQGFRMRWLLGKRTVRHDLLWHCPDLAAVYHMEYDGPAERAAVMEQFAVACCTRNDA